MTKSDLKKQDLEPKLNQFLLQCLGNSDFQVFPVAGDASNRRYYRVVQNEQSWVLMEWEPFEDNEDYPFLSVLNHFRASGVNVPKIHGKSPETGLVLLEDLGDLTLERKFWEFQKKDLVLPFYEQAMDELIKIHFQASTSQNKNCTAFRVQFDFAKFNWEMNYAKANLVEKFGDTALSETESKELDKYFKTVCETLDKEPKCISHRDYHSRNLMLKLGKMYVIDFQDARQGPIQYDLVSLLHDSYVDMPETLRDQLLSYYLEASGLIKDPKFSQEQFNYIFDIQLIQRCFKACGSFTSFYNLREDRRYLHYIHPTLAKVINCLNQYPDLKGFAQLLEDKGLMNVDYEAL